MRVAMLSMHTSPLAQPGSGDSGGMNVYVRELVGALAQQGVECVVYVRRADPDARREVVVEPGFRVIHIDAGPCDLPKEALPGVIDAYTDGVRGDIERRGGVDLIHANYWLSGVAGHALKHELNRPLVCTFHTLARVKRASGDHEPDSRERAEAEIVGCADAVLANCLEEANQLREHYGDVRGRIEIVSPGVEHAFFSPGDQQGARWALGWSAYQPTLLFVGRIQPLKGVDLAVRALGELDDPAAKLVIVGGASGLDGSTELDKLEVLLDELDLRQRVQFVAPQPHHLLATYYRAADVVVVPSRSESFGLVALEAAACGTPVVASAVGGLLTLVEHGRSGYLVEERSPSIFAAYLDAILDDPTRAIEMSAGARSIAARYTWRGAAQQLRGTYERLAVGALVECG